MSKASDEYTLDGPTPPRTRQMACSSGLRASCIPEVQAIPQSAGSLAWEDRTGRTLFEELRQTFVERFEANRIPQHSLATKCADALKQIARTRRSSNGASRKPAFARRVIGSAPDPTALRLRGTYTGIFLPGTALPANAAASFAALG